MKYCNTTTLDILERSQASHLFCCPIPACGSRHARKPVFDCVAREGPPDSRERATAPGGVKEQDPERRQGQHFGWPQTVGMAEPLDQSDLHAFKQRSATVVKVKPDLQDMLEHLLLHCLDLLRHVVGEHRQTGLGTPTLLLSASFLHGWSIL